MEELEQIDILSTMDQLEALKESMPWADITRELTAWKVAFEREMASIVDDAARDNPSTASVLMHIGDINGRIKAVEYMLELPNVLIQILLDKVKKPNDEGRETEDG